MNKKLTVYQKPTCSKCRTTLRFLKEHGVDFQAIDYYEFPGDFELGYYDRAENRIITVPLNEVTFPTESPSTFQLLDQEDQVHRVPFHRVREVYKDSERIWHRPDPAAAETK